MFERTFAWLVRYRRLDRDYERLPTTSEAMIQWAMIGVMARPIAPGLDAEPGSHNPPHNPMSNTF